MGRRSINTTKSGRYMNPTDQARKEARKRELKKNKKQRQMVRAAVLKGKDPTQIILEMEKMDMMEFNVECQPTLSEKVLKEKRKKLKETLERVMKMYEKENPEYWVEIRRLEVDYEKKRQSRIDYYEAVKHAQAVIVDEIPLPNLDMPSLPDGENETLQANELNNDRSVFPPPIGGILKKSYLPSAMETLKPPGCPPMMYPELSDEEVPTNAEEANVEEDPNKLRNVRFAEDEMDEDGNKDTRLTIKKSKNFSSVQAKLLHMSGQDVNDFMRESEVLYNEKPADNEVDHEDVDGAPLAPSGVPAPAGAIPPPVIPGASQLPPGDTPSDVVQIRPIGLPGPHIPPPHMLRLPTRPLMPGIRMPVGPPPQGIPPRLPPPMSLKPPFRPPNLPPGLLPHALIPGLLPPSQNPNVLSAEPQLIARPKMDDKMRSATIEAKPQIRSLSADVTRFLPTALRVKREDKKRPAKQGDAKELPTMKPEETDKKPTKDDAYSQFMQEMEGLL